MLGEGSAVKLNPDVQQQETLQHFPPSALAAEFILSHSPAALQRGHRHFPGEGQGEGLGEDALGILRVFGEGSRGEASSPQQGAC